MIRCAPPRPSSTLLTHPPLTPGPRSKPLLPPYPLSQITYTIPASPHLFPLHLSPPPPPSSSRQFLVFLGQNLGQVQVTHLRVEFSILGRLLHEEAKSKGVQGLLWESGCFWKEGQGHSLGETLVFEPCFSELSCSSTWKLTLSFLPL